MNIYLKLALSAAVALTLVGCAAPGFFSLGGTIPTEDTTKVGKKYKANFGGYFDACNLNRTYGHVTYHDKYATSVPVRLEGHVVDAAQCVDFGLNAEVGCTKCQGWVEDATGLDLDFPEQGSLGYAKIRYRSQDQKNNPGNGTAYLCVADFGEGANADDSDYLLIKVTSGPYDGYLNSGEVQGNINEEACVW